MAKLSQLVKEMASVTGVPEASVNLLARQLREAGMLSSGGRGPGGADVRPKDCTNLLLALVCRDRGATIPARVATYRASSGIAIWPISSKPRFPHEQAFDHPGLKYDFNDYRHPFLDQIDDNTTLGHLLDMLFESAWRRALLDFLVPGALSAIGMGQLQLTEEEEILLVSKQTAAGVVIEFTPSAYYSKVQISADSSGPAVTIECRVHPDFVEQAWQEGGGADLKVSATVTARTFLHIGRLLAGNLPE